MKFSRQAHNFFSFFSAIKKVQPRKYIHPLPSSSRSTSKSSSAHETSKDYDTGKQDDVYNNRPENYYYGDRSLLRKVNRMSPWSFVNCSGWKFRTKVGPWIPIGMSSNNKNIQLDEILLVMCTKDFKGKWIHQRIHQIANYGRSLISDRIFTERSDLPSTVWSVNAGLSGNLWKPLETCRGGFRQVSEFFISVIVFFKIRKPAKGFQIIHHWQTTRYVLGYYWGNPCWGLKKTKLCFGIDIQNWVWMLW